MLMSRYAGRRAGIITGTTIVSTAQLITALAKSPPIQLLADHILAFGGGIMWNSIVIYAIEIAHPSFRGPLLGMMQGCFLIGQFPGLGFHGRFSIAPANGLGGLQRPL